LAKSTTRATSLSRIRELEVVRAHAGHARSFDDDELRARANEAIEEIEREQEAST